MFLDGCIFELDAYNRLVGVNEEVFSINDAGRRMEVAYSRASDDKFICGAGATFGKFSFSSNVSADEATVFLDYLLTFIESNFSSFEIRLPPEYLNSGLYKIIDLYFNKESQKIINETNQFIPLQDFEGSKSLSKTHRRIFNGLVRKGLRCETTQSIILEGYNLLARNREQRGVSLSLTYDELKEQSEVLRNRFFFFSCLSCNGELMAYSVCVKLSNDVLYVLYWGEDPEFRRDSPVVYLSQKICEFAKANRYKFLDVGISSVSGMLDENLYNFKKRLGCIECRKLIIGGDCARF